MGTSSGVYELNHECTTNLNYMTTLCWFENMVYFT